MSLPKTFTLRAPNGKTIEIPSVGYGTWASGENSWAKDAVLTALKEGYRHLDCAWMYGVDGAIGEAIKQSGIPRDEIFITSKFWPNFGHPEHVELCLDKVLAGMGLEYVDLWLSHWPVVFKPTSEDALKKAWAGHEAKDEDKAILKDKDGVPFVNWEYSAAHLAKQKGFEGSFVPTWKAMQECVRKGKARTAGLSNFSVSEIAELLPHEDDVPISCNQVEVHLWLPQKKMVEFCKEKSIVVTCYSPFAGQQSDGATLLQDEKVKEIAESNSMDVGQLLQSWAVQRGTVPLGKSATPARIKSNLAIRRLEDKDMDALNSMEVPNGNGRSVCMNKVWDIPLFKD